MSRRVSLPGADELFRNTATLSAVPSQRENSEEITQAPVAPSTPKNSVRQTPRRRVNAFDRAPSGREKHDEKITVYLSPDELYDRESLSIIIADLEAKGDQSIIARRLRGR
ncbi:MAG: hypothetical protein RI901_1024 [Actinomycetota bacterium]